MCSLQFDFLDFSDIGEEDYDVLVNILEEKKPEVFLTSSETSPVIDVNDDDEEEDEDEKITLIEEDDFISQTRKDEGASGISFFIDGGTAEDIDLEQTPPMLSANVTPPPSPSDSPSTLCNDQDDMPLEEEPVNMYPHVPPPPYMNHPPPMMQHMNVHNVPTSASLYNIPTYQTHSAPGVHNAIYQHIPHNHAHQLLPHTVHIENCHVNLSPFGNPQPAHPSGALYATPPPMSAQYQVPSHPQIYQPYITDQQPPMSMKSNMDKDYDHKRHDPHSRGTYRGRGRGRGRRRGGREDHERSNSVSSDHSSYSDSGSKNHYKDNNPTTPTLPPNHPFSHLMPYPTFIPYNMAQIQRTPQGYPIMSPFIPYSAEQPHHILAYPPQPPPVSVALISNDGANHSDYIGSTNYEGAASLETYSYSSVDNTSNVEVMSQDVAISSPSEYNQNNGNINLVVTCTSNEMVLREDCNVLQEDCNENMNMDPQIEYIERKVPRMKIEVENVSLVTTISIDKTPVENEAENITMKEIENRETISPEPQTNEVQTTQATKNIRNGKSKSPSISNIDKPSKNQEKSQAKGQNGNQKLQKIVQPIANSVSTLDSSNPVIITQKSSVVSSGTQKGKENGISSKSKRKNSPHNKDNSSTKSASPEPTPNDALSEISFGIDTITVYNQSLAPILQTTKEFTKNSSKQEEQNVKLKDTLIIKPTQPTKVVVKNNEDSVLDKDSSVTFINSRNTIVPSGSEQFQPKIDVELPPQEKISLTTVQQLMEPPAWGQKKSWSQLFKPNEDFSPKQIAFVSPFNAKENNDSASAKITLEKENGDISYSDSEIEKVKVGAQIKKFNPDFRPVLLQPRGLINKNYWCYVNAPLQALLACPSFYQLAKSLSQDAGRISGNLSTPFINSIVDFASEFNSMTPIAKSRKEKGGAKKEPEIVPGAPFEPTCVYKTLCKTNQFTEGRQQDAEEMLSCFLNGLHDEMVESIKLAGGSDVTQNGISSEVQNGTEQNLPDEENEWKVQGPKKKSYVTRTAHFHPSPISQIFWGQLRCVLHHAGGNTTANLQPFNTLPLDIQSPKVNTVKDALSQLVTREEISGFTCPKTNQEVTASNQVMFEDLPRVLILQLKRFIYDNGGLQKVTKRLQFQIDLEITKDLISMNRRGKFSASQRKYKLFGIVNHEGKEANKGHYVADVFHNGYNCWLRYDDSNVKPISEAVVLGHEPPRVPYLLFYRRMDTLSPPSPHQQNGNGSGSGSSSSSCNGKN